MSDFLPPLPAGYCWQLVAEDGRDCTGDYYAETDAVEARIWTDSSDIVLVLKRTGDHGHWGGDGLRKWEIEGMAPQGLHDWEQFEVLSDIPHRLAL